MGNSAKQPVLHSQPLSQEVSDQGEQRKRGRPSVVSKPVRNAYFSAPSESLELVPSGCQLLDCVLGGGYVLGSICNIVGDKSTGKTLLAIEACTNFLLKYPKGKVMYVEAEAAFDLEYAKALGLPVKEVQMEQGVDTVEQLFNLLVKFIDDQVRNHPGLVIVDSLDALTDQAETERGIEEGSYGAAKAKKMSELFRRLIRKLKQSRTCVLIISQVRDAIGVSFGRKTTRTGGRALDFYASQILYLAQIETLKRTINKLQRPFGVRIKAKADKNKIGLPFRECTFAIRFGYGIDDLAACLEWLTEVGKLDVVGLKESDVSRTLKSLDGLTREQFEELRQEVAEAVKKVWEEIEITFLPQRSKYAEL